MAVTESSHTDKNPANDPFNTAGKILQNKRANKNSKTKK